MFDRRSPSATPATAARRERQGAMAGPAASLLGLQRAAGNHAVSRILARDEAAAPAKQGKGGLDAKAEAIVKAAGDTSVEESKRAVALVRSIIDTYLSGDAGLIKEIVWDASEKTGVSVDSPTKKDAQGTIHVGPGFLAQATTSGFARRVIQVDHELEHVRQQRAGGMGGPKNSALREFLAFHREAMQKEFAGTGRVSHSTRVNLIDAALKNYYKLTDEQKASQAAKKDELLEFRKEHDGQAGNPKTEPPSGG